jgi:DNA gyrase subunit B
MVKSKQYDIDSISHLKGLEGIKRRPTMYIGDVGKAGVNHLVKEVINNSVDEYLNGHGSNVIFSYSKKDKTFTVQDEGRGIPYDPKTGFEKIVCNIHASGKFDEDSYKTAAGLNGVGITAVNALSEWMIIVSYKNGFEWNQEFHYGEPQALVKGDKTKETGTIISFKPDKEIMETDEADFDSLLNYLELQSYVNSECQFIVINEDTEEEITYYHENGLKDYVTKNNKKPLFKKIFTCSDKKEYKKDKKNIRMEYEVAIGYGKSNNEEIISFANTIPSIGNGTHVTGLKLAIVNAVNEYIKSKPNILTKEEKKLTISGDDVRSGIVAGIEVKHNHILFKGQTKEQVSNTDLQGFISSSVKKLFLEWLESNPKESKVIINNAILNAKARKAAKRAKDAVIKKGESNLTIVSDLSKLADCLNKDPKDRELFIVEGKLNCSL